MNERLVSGLLTHRLTDYSWVDSRRRGASPEPAFLTSAPARLPDDAFPRVAALKLLWKPASQNGMPRTTLEKIGHPCGSAMRVSNSDQNLELQLEALRRAGCDKVFTEQASGAPEGACSNWRCPRSGRRRRGRGRNWCVAALVDDSSIDLQPSSAMKTTLVIMMGCDVEKDSPRTHLRDPWPRPVRVDDCLRNVGDTHGTTNKTCPSTLYEFTHS